MNMLWYAYNLCVLLCIKLVVQYVTGVYDILSGSMTHPTIYYLVECLNKCDCSYDHTDACNWTINKQTCCRKYERRQCHRQYAPTQYGRLHCCSSLVLNPAGIECKIDYNNKHRTNSNCCKQCAYSELSATFLLHGMLHQEQSYQRKRKSSLTAGTRRGIPAKYKQPPVSQSKVIFTLCHPTSAIKRQRTSMPLSSPRAVPLKRRGYYMTLLQSAVSHSFFHTLGTNAHR